VNCPHCKADITEEINDFTESMGYSFGYIFVCPKCKKAFGIKTDRGGKAEELR
jgi:transposase-like protein